MNINKVNNGKENIENINGKGGRKCAQIRDTQVQGVSERGRS